jgi:5,6-dimethylbenzimidazole synthase
MAFGPPAKAPYKRWRRQLPEILNWNRFDPAHHMSDEALEDWISNQRHRVMYKDASKID